MKDVFKKYKTIILTLLFYCLLAIFIGDYIPFEFANTTFKNIYFIIVYITFPVLLIWTTVSVIKLKRPTIFISVSILVSFFCLLILSIGNTMCNTTSETIYKSINGSQTIVRRSCNCGAWDSDFPSYGYYKITPVTGLFNLVTKFDTTNLDKKAWVNSSYSYQTNYYEAKALVKAANQKVLQK